MATARKSLLCSMKLNGAHKNHDMDTYRDAVRDGLVRSEKSSDQQYAKLSRGGGGGSGW